ncbi:KLDC3 protein, partial [Polypterus senegalus]
MLRWTVHLEGGPRRVNHAAVSVGHKVYSFGGYCSGEDYETLRQIDVHVFNAVSLRWTKLPPVRTSGREHAREVPYMRYGHTAVLVDDTIYVWGGRNDTEGACNVLYAFDVNNHKWFTPRISGTVPGARDGHSACVLGKCMYIFGGYEQLADCFSNDIHKLDTTTMVWTLISAKVWLCHSAGSTPGYKIKGATLPHPGESEMGNTRLGGVEEKQEMDKKKKNL